jgi:hypothetical protein
VKKATKQPLVVEVLETKENPLCTEEQRRIVRFLRYNRFVPCAECGKKVRIHLTMLCEFLAMNKNSILVAKFTGKVHPPLTPVCGDHPLAIAWPEPAKKPTKK